jgi:sec-independent protein translocase protein TatB
MPGFEDSAIIVLLALLLFGPKKLPVLARQFGKLMADFRRASSEFRTQMEDELRLSEQAERQKQIAAPATTPATGPAQAAEADPYSAHSYPIDSAFDSTPDSAPEPVLESMAQATPETAPSPLPIATSGELSIQPPPTGLPTPHSAPSDLSGALPNTSEEEALHG